MRVLCLLKAQHLSNSDFIEKPYYWKPTAYNCSNTETSAGLESILSE